MYVALLFLCFTIVGFRMYKLAQELLLKIFIKIWSPKHLKGTLFIQTINSENADWVRASSEGENSGNKSLMAFNRDWRMRYCI